MNSVAYARLRKQGNNGVQLPVKKYKFFINNRHTNHIWQVVYHDQRIDFRTERYPMVLIEINPKDAKELGIKSRDVVTDWTDRNVGYPTTREPGPISVKSVPWKTTRKPSHSNGDAIYNIVRMPEEVPV